MRLNEDVLDRILEILEQKQRFGKPPRNHTWYFGMKTIWQPRSNYGRHAHQMYANSLLSKLAGIEVQEYRELGHF
jgi:hypothetical protein